MLNILKAYNKDSKVIKELGELKKRPKKEKGDNMPHFEDFIPFYTQQLDLIHLPTAKYGFKYLLVIVDNNTRKFDAEPLKERTANVVASAFKRIYTRDILKKLPHRVEVDAGVEFQGEFKNLMKELNIKIRVAETNRHRQQALVETKNSFIGKLAFGLLDYNELTKGKRSADWYESKEKFRFFIKELNEKSKAKPVTDQISDKPIVTDQNKDLLNVGDSVRTLLDYPIDIANKKRQHGKFRATDIRWSLDVKKIRWVVLKPGQPPMYRVQGEKILRTIQQLQKV